jgi:hypothetical protein
MWVSGGRQEDVFWRSAMSGGRATIAAVKGKVLTAQAGDITAIHSQGYSLTNRFFIETKFYKNLGLVNAIFGKGNLVNFWKIAQREAARYKRLPLLIAKQNRDPALLCIDSMGLHFLNCRANAYGRFPYLDMIVCDLRAILNVPYTKTRLLSYDYSRAMLDFYLHQRGAAARSLEFEFEFEEWVSWWEENLGPNWQRLRGRQRDQYVMARNKDKGPYAAWNVRCITQSENISEKGVNGTAARGTKIWTNKLSEKQVIEIFYDTRSAIVLAAEYDVSVSMIYLIKKRNNWKYLLDKLPKVRRYRGSISNS